MEAEVGSREKGPACPGEKVGGPEKGVGDGEEGPLTGLTIWVLCGARGESQKRGWDKGVGLGLWKE